MRTLDGFDFSAQPSLDPGQVRDLAACRWVANGDAILMLGVGKTHLATGLGRTIRGDSYRLREKRRSGLLQRAGAAPENPETA